MKNQIKKLMKKDPVMVVAWILAIISMFIVAPDKKYVGYVDVRTLVILFCLMCVVAGFKELDVFDSIGGKLISVSKYLVQIVAILVLMCFFFSMIITNDVALITFVPLTLIIMNKIDVVNKEWWTIFIVVLQTVAANLGSMLTPIGNPQNLYLYGISDMSMMEFVQLMLPTTIISLALIIILILAAAFARKGLQPATVRLEQSENEHLRMDKKKRIIYFAEYGILLLLSLATVARMINMWILLLIVIIIVTFSMPAIFKRVDYNLLITFVGFFIFVGNMGRIEAFREFLGNIIAGREVLTGIITSQVTSNVPAALLLSGFTDNIKSLIIGTNVGGLGTLIASMASLISYKAIASEHPKLKGRYFVMFTVVNVALVLVLGMIVC